MDLAINFCLPNPSGDKLGILGAKIKYQYLLFIYAVHDFLKWLWVTDAVGMLGVAWLFHPIIGCLFDDNYIVDMTLLVASRCNLNKGWLCL